MAVTNDNTHFVIIINNLPKFFSERIICKFGVKVNVAKALVKMRASMITQFKVTATAKGKIKTYGKVNSKFRVDFSINPKTRLTGKGIGKATVDCSAIARLKTRASLVSQHTVRCSARCVVAIFWKIYERNDNIIEDVNDLTLEQFCIKEV